jgi:hypothetical protein
MKSNKSQHRLKSYAFITLKVFFQYTDW